MDEEPLFQLSLHHIQVTRENLDKNRKVNVNFTIDKHLYEQFKRVAQKDMRKYSNIVENGIRRYVQSKVLGNLPGRAGLGAYAHPRLAPFPCDNLMNE